MDTRVDLYGSGILTPLEESLAKRAMAVLHKHYPGFGWMIDINGGMLNIKAGELFGQHGYRINVLEHQDAALDKEVMRAGGQLLEHFLQPRNRGPRQELLAEVPRNARGHMVPDK